MRQIDMPLSYSTVIVPVDFSGQSTEAVRAGLSVVDDSSQLHLIHVLLPLDSISPLAALGDLSDEARQDHTAAQLEKIAEENDADSAQRAVLFGSPGLEITDYAQRHHADLIVIPSHGYHGVKRLILGSVAERVIRHASCSVLVLRRTDAE
jgi:nucleotide-binding universal stress UspA family protein